MDLKGLLSLFNIGLNLANSHLVESRLTRSPLSLVLSI